MSRRDTIIIAVLVNSGLLAILFLMAAHVDNDSQNIPFSEVEAIQKEDVIEAKPVESGAVLTTDHKEPVPDEVDVVIHELDINKEKPSKPEKAKNDMIEITVKKGDFLEKIANANGTTVSAIKRANQLTTDRLDIGQVLKIPKGLGQASEVKKETQKESAIEWYTVESGDNPWTIAKKFNVRFDKLLEMNSLDEEKARNLRAGDRLRVR